MMEMKSNFGGAKGGLDSERSFVDRVSVEFKSIFFRYDFQYEMIMIASSSRC